MIGIYTITNTKNGRIYIGASMNIKHRWSEHLGHLRHEDHRNRRLQEDWNKQQEADFKFSIIELCNAEQLRRLELQTINQIQKSSPIYNVYDATSIPTDEINVTQAAKLLQASVSTIHNMIERGSLEAHKLDPTAKSVYRIPTKEIDRILGERTNPRNQPGRKQ